MAYIRKEYNATILPYFHKHIKLYEAKIYPVCQRGKQSKITLPWEKVPSKDKTLFHLQISGNKDEIDSLTIAEFVWQSQNCFAYIKHSLMIVFSGHALSRYEERVIGNSQMINGKQTFKRLMKYIPLSYRTILPSPSHPLCYYYVVLNALFLGDFDETTYLPDQKEGEIWLNTCISLKEAGPTQKGILKTLSLMPYFIKDIGFNPFDTDKDFKETYTLRTDAKKWSSLQCFCESVFLIDKLFVMMDLPVSETVRNVFYTEMRYAEALLQLGGTDVSKLTPYGSNGIAIRGELEYKSKT